MTSTSEGRPDGVGELSSGMDNVSAVPPQMSTLARRWASCVAFASLLFASWSGSVQAGECTRGADLTDDGVSEGNGIDPEGICGCLVDRHQKSCGADYADYCVVETLSEKPQKKFDREVLSFFFDETVDREQRCMSACALDRVSNAVAHGRYAETCRLVTADGALAIGEMDEAATGTVGRGIVDGPANLRNHHKSGKKVATAADDEEVLLIDQEGDWWLIEGPSGIGWTHRKNIKKVLDGIPTKKAGVAQGQSARMDPPPQKRTAVARCSDAVESARLGKTVTVREEYSAACLRKVRNAVYARHGRRFKSKDLDAFFTSKRWYKPSADYSAKALTEVDRKNVEVLRKRERRLKKSAPTSTGK